MDILDIPFKLSKILPEKIMIEYAPDFTNVALALEFFRGNITPLLKNQLIGGAPDKLYDSLLEEVGFTDKEDVNRKLLEKKLNIKPLKSKYMVYENGFMWQADLKHIPVGQDNWPYLLVCVDVSTRKMDAEPIKTTSQQDVIHAITTIFRRHIIQEGLPKIIVTDGGPEFGNLFTDFLNRNNIKHRKTVAGRKEQTAIVEHTNELLGFALMANAYKRRVNNRDPNSRPLNYKAIRMLDDNILSRIVNKINDWATSRFPLKTDEWFKFSKNTQPSDLVEGDRVLIPNLNDERIRKRSGQHNFKNTIYYITRVYTPTLEKEPYRYATNFNNKLTFKRDELIKVGPNIGNLQKEEFRIKNPIIEFSHDNATNFRLNRQNNLL